MLEGKLRNREKLTPDKAKGQKNNGRPEGDFTQGTASF
jgi:hypothetical protein